MGTSPGQCRKLVRRRCDQAALISCLMPSRNSTRG
jgi:hypothetical protein